MRKPVLLFTALLLFGASLAHAQGALNLAWNNCITQAASAADKAYACDGSANGTPYRIVMSFVSPDNLTKFVGMQAVLDVRVQGLAALPDWWKVGVGECRDGNMIFPAGLTGIGTGTTGACQNPWAGGNTGGGFAWYSEILDDPGVPPNSPRPTWGRAKFAFARDTEANLVQGNQYIGGVVQLDTFNDVDSGSGVCAGCAVPACLVLNQMELFQTAGSPGGDVVVITAPGTRQYVTWQGGAIGGNGCPIEVPTRNITWGSIKAIYR